MKMLVRETQVTLLTRAFEKDPMFVLLFKGENRLKQMKQLLCFLLRRNTLTDGIILVDSKENPSYVAIVDKPVGLRKVSVGMQLLFQMEMLLMIFKLPFRILNYFSQYQQITASFAPKEPHYYLTMIGVDPGLQGRGIGSHVLQEIHKMAGRSKHPVALDTENPVNVDYYEKKGYELSGSKQLKGVTIYCMVKRIKINN